MRCIMWIGFNFSTSLFAAILRRWGQEANYASCRTFSRDAAVPVLGPNGTTFSAASAARAHQSGIGKAVSSASAMYSGVRVLGLFWQLQLLEVLESLGVQCSNKCKTALLMVSHWCFRTLPLIPRSLELEFFCCLDASTSLGLASIPEKYVLESKDAEYI